MPTKKSNNDTPPKNAKLGWHFLPADMSLEYSDGRKAEVGKTLSIANNVTPYVCHSGMHASAKITDAANFKKGPVMTRVKVWGDLSEDYTKFAGRHRHVLWAKALTLKDIAKCLKDVGYASTSPTSLTDGVNQLGYAAASSGYESKVEKWLTKWAEDNGVNGRQTIKITYEKQELTEKALKQFLSDRMVRTEGEIRKDMENAWECDGGANQDLETLEDFLSSSSDDYGGMDIISIANYGANGDTGYVLKQKRKR